MSDIVGKLWGFCNVLRDDGINYGDYIEQLTYLLFLKIADEKKLPIPKGCDWQTLKEKSGTELLEHYNQTLRSLSKENAILKFFKRKTDRLIPVIKNPTISGIKVIADDKTGLAKDIEPIMIGGNLKFSKN